MTIARRTKMFNNLKKEMPTLNKETLELFVQWFEGREKVRKIISKKKDEPKIYLDYLKICEDFLSFLLKNVKTYENYKIKWQIMEKYLVADINFCKTQLQIYDSVATSKLELEKKNKENKTK